MFLKEIFSVLTFGFVTLVLSGFAIKVDKFEYAVLSNNKLDMPIENWKKLKLDINKDFHYVEDRVKKTAKVWDYRNWEETRGPKKIKYMRVILDVDGNSRSNFGIGPHSGFFVDFSPQSGPTPISPTKTSNARKSKEETTKMIKYFVETKSFWSNMFC